MSLGIAQKASSCLWLGYLFLFTWSTSSPHMALTATEKPTRHFTSEIEDDFVSCMTQQLHLSKETRLSFDQSANPTNNRLLFKLLVIPGCQNDLRKDDPWSRSSLNTEYTCSGEGIGDYLPISTLVCYKSIGHKVQLHLSTPCFLHYIFKF